MSQTDTTVIAQHTFIKGELHLEGPTIISGRVEGQIISQEALEIAPDGVVEGDIQGVLVDIQGTLKGNVVAARACRLGATARVTGELRAANLAIAEGACFVGQVHVGGSSVEIEETPDVAEEISTVHTMTNTIQRLESMAMEANDVAETATALPAPTPVRVLPQTVQQTLNRSPRIIKAR